MNIVPLGKLARRLHSALSEGGIKPNVLRGYAKSDAEFAQAVGELFLHGLVRFNGKTTGRVLERKP